MEWIQWFSESPPAPWIWIGLFVGFVAFLGWLMDTIINIIRRPKLKLHFISSIYTIRCWIQNIPFGNDFLMQRRSVQSLTVSIAIRDMDAEEKVVHWDETARKLQFGDDEEHRCIMLPASKYGVNISIARASELKSLAVDENGEPNIELHEGRYKVEMAIWVNGKEIEVSRDFKVSRSKPFIEWVYDGEINL